LLEVDSSLVAKLDEDFEKNRARFECFKECLGVESAEDALHRVKEEMVPSIIQK